MIFLNIIHEFSWKIKNLVFLALKYSLQNHLERTVDKCSKVCKCTTPLQKLNIWNIFEQL